MADLVQPSPRLPALSLDRLKSPWTVTIAAPLAVAMLDFANFVTVISFAVWAFIGTLPFIAFAVLLIAGLKAAGAEAMIADALRGP